MEIRNFDNEQTMIALKVGKARTIENHFNFIHIIDLEHYNEQTSKLFNTIESFSKHSTLKDAAKICKLKLKGLESKLQTLNPYKRPKRALFNGIGSVIKYITGNMDANDAQTINRQIQELQEIASNSVSIAENQKGLNIQMMQRFKNLTDHINNEQETISKFIGKLSTETSNSIQKENDALAEIQYVNQLNYNIDLLVDHISDIIEAVMLAKLGIISKLILNPDELKEIRDHLRSQNVDFVSDGNLYELLELQAYYNNSNLIFNIKLPNFSKDTSLLYHLIPLPINQTKIIKTKPYVSYNAHNLQYYTEICPKIENTYYCKMSNDFEETSNSKCIGRILDGQSPICPVNDVGITSTIFQPEDNYIIIINVEKILITSSCRKNFTIRGTLLLHYENCSVTIAGTTYRDNPHVHWDTMFVAPPNLNKIQVESTTDTLTLQKIKAYSFINKNDILRLRKNTIQSGGILTATALIFVIITFTCLILLWKNPKVRYYPQPADVVLSPPNSLWPSLYSKRGGVMLSHKPPSKPLRTTTAIQQQQYSNTTT